MNWTLSEVTLLTGILDPKAAYDGSIEYRTKYGAPTGDMILVNGYFQREAQAASALNHPNICTIYEIGQQDGQP